MSTTQVERELYAENLDEPAPLQKELRWGMSYRILKEEEHSSVITPKHSPINVPFHLCRAGLRPRKRKQRKCCCPKPKSTQSCPRLSLLDRSILSQDAYMELLSTPNRAYVGPTPRKERKRRPTCCKCLIEPCPPRIIQMAVPNKRIVLSNWKAYGDVLPTETIVRFDQMLKSGDNLEPREARYYFKKLQKKKRRELRKRKKLCKKRLKAKKRGADLWLRIEIDELVDALLCFIRNQPLFMLNFQQMMTSNQLINYLIQERVVKIKTRNTRNEYHKAIIEISDKLVRWMDAMSFFVDVRPLDSKEKILEVPSLESLLAEEEVVYEDESEEGEPSEEEGEPSEEEGELSEEEEGRLRRIEEEEYEDVIGPDGALESFVAKKLLDKAALFDYEHGEGEEGSLLDIFHMVDEDTLNKLIKILEESPEEFLNEQVDPENLPDITYGDILNKLREIRDGTLTTAKQDPFFLEEKIVDWAQHNEPEAVDEKILNKIHETSLILAELFKAQRKLGEGDEALDASRLPKIAEEEEAEGGAFEEARDVVEGAAADAEEEKKGSEEAAEGWVMVGAEGEEGKAAEGGEEGKAAEGGEEGVLEVEGAQEPAGAEGEEGMGGEGAIEAEAAVGEGEEAEGGAGEEAVEGEAAVGGEGEEAMAEGAMEGEEAVGEGAMEGEGGQAEAVGGEGEEDAEGAAGGEESEGVFIEGEEGRLATIEEYSEEEGEFDMYVPKGQRAGEEEYGEAYGEGGRYEYGKRPMRKQVGEYGEEYSSEMGEYEEEEEEEEEARREEYKPTERLEPIEGLPGVIKRHRPFDVIEHRFGTICCLSLKIWAVWLLEIANNAHSWTKWIRGLIQQVRHYAAVIRGDVTLPNGEKKILYKEEWRRFVSNTQENVCAWKEYSQHVRNLSREIVDNFHGKPVLCCPKCLEDNLIKNVVTAHETLRALTEAINFAEFWQKCLNSIVEETTQLTDLDAGTAPDVLSLSSEESYEVEFEDITDLQSESGDSFYEIVEIPQQYTSQMFAGAQAFAGPPQMFAGPPQMSAGPPQMYAGPPQMFMAPPNYYQSEPKRATIELIITENDDRKGKKGKKGGKEKKGKKR